jgi:hypothetical protein
MRLDKDGCSPCTDALRQHELSDGRFAIATDEPPRSAGASAAGRPRTKEEA